MGILRGKKFQRNFFSGGGVPMGPWFLLENGWAGVGWPGGSAGSRGGAGGGAWGGRVEVKAGRRHEGADGRARSKWPKPNRRKPIL